MNRLARAHSGALMGVDAVLVEVEVDMSIGLQYRPLFTQNIVVNASGAVLRPRKGLRELYGNAVDATQYSLLLNILLTF